MNSLLLTCFLVPALSAAELKPETLNAWEDYLQTANSHMKERLHRGAHFLWLDESPDRRQQVRSGEILAAPFDEGDMKLRLDDTDVSIVFRIAGKGKGSATFWTCDLTEDYVHINANYRT